MEYPELTCPFLTPSLHMGDPSRSHASVSTHRDVPLSEESSLLVREWAEWRIMS